MKRFVPVLLLLTPACGTNTEVEPQLTITQGLYGQLTQRCDTMGCVGAPRDGTPVGWFESNPFARDGGVGPEPRLSTTSGPNGFYEFALENGASGYLALGVSRTSSGVQWFTATREAVPLGLARVDWQASADAEGIWRDVK